MAAHSKFQTVFLPILKRSARNFALGFLLNSVLSLLGYVLRILNPRKRKSNDTEQTIEKLKKTILDCIQSGLFLGSWTLQYYLLSRLFTCEKSLRILLAGFISGFSSMFMHQGLGWRVSLYCVLRSLLGLYRVHKSRFPRWINKFPGVLTYALINVGLGYMFCYKTDYLDRGYGKFISDAANVTYEGSLYMFQGDSGLLPDCSPLYHKEEKCLDAFKNHSWIQLKTALQVYTSLFLMTPLLSGQLIRAKHKFKLLKQIVKNIGWSTMFLWTQCMFCARAPCIKKYLLGNRNTKLPILLMWFIGPLAISLEYSHRRTEISLFSFWRLLTATINLMNNVKNMHFGEEHSERFQLLTSSLFFAVASGIWMYCLEKNPKGLKSLDRSLLMWLFPKIKPWKQ